MHNCNFKRFQSNEPIKLKFHFFPGGVYHRERQYFQHLPNLQFIAACIPPDGYGKGGPNRELNPRLRRRMNIINMMPLSDESLRTIYTSIYKAWLEEFPAYSLTHIDPLAKVSFVLLDF